MRGPIQIENMVFCAGETIVSFYHVGKKLEMFLIKEFHVLTAWAHLFTILTHSCGKFFQDGTSDGNLLPPLEASRRCPDFRWFRMRFVFLGKNHRLRFFQNFPCEVKVLGACDHKAVVELDSFFMTNCCFLCETSVYLNCLEQKICP
jgi:hypothetical protein